MFASASLLEVESGAARRAGEGRLMYFLLFFGTDFIRILYIAAFICSIVGLRLLNLHRTAKATSWRRWDRLHRGGDAPDRVGEQRVDRAQHAVELPSRPPRRLG